MQYVSDAFSAIALIVSILAFVENRRNDRLRYAPAIIGYEQEDPAGYLYAIQNKGGGPAYFEKVEFFVDRKPLHETSLRDVVAKQLSEKGLRYSLSITHPAEQNIMQPGEQIALLKIEVPPEDAGKLKSIPSNRFGVRISFRSAHGKRHVWSSDDELK